MPSERLTMGQPALNRVEQPSAARVLVGDTYVGFRLLKEALRRITGVPTDASFLTTLFAIGILASAFRIPARVLRVFRAGHPSFADTMMGGAVIREAPGGIGGARTRGTPFAGTLIAISLMAPALRLVVSALRLIAVPARWVRNAFAGLR
jgi:hypothetical protein